MPTSYTWIENPCRLAKNILMLCALTLMIIVSSIAQDTTPSTTIDWATRTTGQQVCVQPGANPAVAKLKLINPNVILYSYTLDVKSYPIPGDDGKFLQGLSGVSGTSKVVVSTGTCDDNAKKEFDAAVKSIWTSSLFPQHRESIPLDQTRIDLTTHASDIDLLNRGVPPGCTPDNPQALRTELEYLPIYKKASENLDNAGSPEVDFSYSVDNKHWNQFNAHQERI